MGRGAVKGRRGQAITEYLLMLATVMTILVLLQMGFQRIAHGLWKQMVCDISAPCVMCRPPAKIAEFSRIPAACRVQ